MTLVATAQTVSNLSSNVPEMQITTLPIHSEDPVVPLRKKSFSFGVKPPVVTFVGRTAELGQINAIYSGRKEKIAVIWAMGGQGKTQLAKKFIHDLTSNSEVTPPVVIWLKADSFQQLSASLSKLAPKVGVVLIDPTSGKPLPLQKLVKRIIASVNEKYPTSPRWLIVFDNVDEEYSEFEEIVGKFVHPTEIFPLLLITSRRNDIFPRAAVPLSLQTLSPVDAQELVRNALGNVTEKDAIDLCTTLDHHALSLEQALAYICAQRRSGLLGKSYSIHNFLEDYSKSSKTKTVLQYPPELSDYNHTIHLIVHTTLTFIQNNHPEMKEMVQELCFILGLIHPDGIKLVTLLKFIQPYNTIFKSSTEGPGESVEQSLSSLTLVDIEAEAAILVLAKFSLVSLNNAVVSVHRVVQSILRLEHNSQTAFSNFIAYIDKFLMNATSSEELLHIRSIWSHADEEAVKEIPRFANKIFHKMLDPSLRLQLVGFAQQNHYLLSKILGPEHEATVEMEHNVAYALRKKCAFEESLEKFKQVLKKEERILGKHHSSTLDTLSEIGLVLYHLERHEESLAWYDRFLKNDGDDKDKMTTRNRMAFTLQELGRVEEALAIHHQILNWKLVTLGCFHRSTLITRGNISAILLKQGRLKEGRAQVEEILAIRTEVIGAEQALTLNTKAWLSSIIWDLGDKKKSIELAKEVLASREKVLGHDHPRTQIIRDRVSEMEKLRFPHPVVAVLCISLILFSIREPLPKIFNWFTLNFELFMFQFEKLFPISS